MSKQDKEVYTRRAFILAAGKVTLASALVSRLFYLQVWRSDHYKTLANGNRIRLELTSPLRGLIKDRNGNALASNIKSFRVVMVPQDVPDLTAALNQVSQVVDLSEESKAQLYQKTRKVPKSMPIAIKEDLDWDQVARIEVRTPTLPGIYVEEGLNRHYPNSASFAHILGYVQTPDETKINENVAYKLPGAKIGKVGLENHFEETLFGTPGYREIEVNSRGKEIRKLSKKDTLKGQDLSLSIDRDLQMQIFARLSNEQSASAVVLKIPSGEILAMSSNPSFDPNLFVQGVNQQQWTQWMENPYKPLLNKTIQGEYAPGSIFKLVVGLAALENNIITEDEKIFCPGYMMQGNHKFHCWKKHGHGNKTLVHAMRDSCDVFFYEIAKRVGIEKIAAMAKQLGLGRETGLELQEERSGLVPDKQWKKKRFGNSWTIGETVLAGIGQGYMLATPLQLALLGARIATGQTTKPTLLLNNEEATHTPLNIKKRNLNLMMKGMNLAVNSATGTARMASIDIPGWSLGGKTSTSQVRRVSLKEREKGRTSIPWHLRDHAMFMGIAPMENPKYIVALVVEHGGWASKAAVPIAKDIANMLYEFDRKGSI